MSNPRLDTQQSAAEYVCLECPLPECDENNIGCRYRVLCPLPSMKRAHYSQGSTCPVCGAPITNGSRTCGKHTGYK